MWGHGHFLNFESLKAFGGGGVGFRVQFESQDSFVIVGSWIALYMFVVLKPKKEQKCKLFQTIPTMD